MAPLLLDLLVVVLLTAACVYCMVLNRKLTAMRRAQAELSAAIETFDRASRRTAESIRKIEGFGVEDAQAIISATARAEVLSSELSIMVSAGERIADRLDAAADGMRSGLSRRVA